MVKETSPINEMGGAEYKIQTAQGWTTVEWELGQGQDGKPYAFRGNQIVKSVQVEGILGEATVTLEGSNSGRGWEVLHDLQGNPLLFTIPGISSISEGTKYIRPCCMAGNEETKVVITLLVT